MIEVLLITRPYKAVTFSLSLVPTESFIFFFPIIVPYQLNHFEITNETASSMHCFILKCRRPKFYSISLVVNEMK
jgi:hypothetical protein